MALFLYYPIAIAGLAILCLILLAIGRSTQDCPQLAGAAKLASLIVTTGFATIGLGVVALLGAMIEQMGNDVLFGVSVALGLCGIALGIGFWTAAINLRDILKDSQLTTSIVGSPS
ncbi:MAG: hypothetical protein AAGE80_16605 [Pseudomonadota bacterium]